MDSRIGILVGPRGRGSNMRAIAQACADGRLNASVACVVAPIAEAPVVEIALGLELNVQIVSPTELDYGDRLKSTIGSAGCTVVCLAGYLRLLPEDVLAAYPRRILNIHPALLPKFGGKGMYGMRVHEAVLAAGETESGCTVHLVSDRYDEGEIVLQRRCPVLAGDTPETLAARVLEQEHLAYVDALKKVLVGT